MEAVEVVADCREIEMTNLASFYFQGLRKVCKFGEEKKKLGSHIHKRAGAPEINEACGVKTENKELSPK